MKKVTGNRLGMIAVVLLGMTALAIYITNRYVPFMMDDLWYSTLLYEDTPIRGVSDIVNSQIWHYQNWGGRSVAHACLQLILLAGESFADVLNTIVVFLLAGSMCLLVKRSGPVCLLAAAGLMLGLNANWELSMFWQSGAVNYLYMTVFIVLFSFCYLREMPEAGVWPEKKRLPGIALWILPLGLAAGWSNENMGPAVWILSVAAILIMRRGGRKTPIWMYLGSLACLVGSVLMIAAPGNSVRGLQVKEKQYGILWQAFLRCYAECKGLFLYLFPSVLLLLVVLFLHKAILRKRIALKIWMLIGVATLSFGAMLLSPHYPDRASFGTMIFLIVPILMLAEEILHEKEELRIPMFVVTVLIWLRGMFFCGEFVAYCLGWIV